MTSIIVAVLLLATAVTAQPVKLNLEVSELDNSMAVQTGIDGSKETRNVSFPMGTSFEIVCSSTGTLPTNPWVFVNSSGQYDVETSNSAAVYSMKVDQSQQWRLTVAGFTSDIAGVYECVSNDLVQSVRLVEGNPGVTLSNSEFTFENGGSASALTFLVSGNPYPDLGENVWYKDGVELTQEEISSLELFFNGNSVFFNPSYEHDGLYTVVVKNSQGTANDSTRIIIIGPPMVSLSVSTDKIYIEDSFELTCNVTEGFPVPDIAWYHNNVKIISGQDNFVVADYWRSSILTVMNSQSSHSGEYQCFANNSVSSTVEATQVEISLLPPPKPTVTISSNGIIYAGSSVTLNCSTSLTHPTHADKDVTTVWKLDGVNINITASNSRHSVQEETMDELYSSLLTIDRVSSTADNRNYSCSIIIHDDAVSSESNSLNNVKLDITIPSISITVSPSTTDIVDFSPYNSVSLNCTASIPTGITVDIKFQWLQGSVVLNSTDSLSITQDNGSSSLVGQIDTAGTHQYTCNLIVTLSLLDPPVTSSDNVTVNVQGPSLPNFPLNPTSHVVSFSSVGIKFAIHEISYSHEEYYVLYGTSSDNLSFKSSIVQGNEDITTNNEQFDITLHHLDHNTVYYYVIIASNSNGVTRTDVKIFQTPRIALTQFKAGPFRGCENGRVQDSTSVQSFFNEKLSERISISCDCSFPQVNLINGSLHCTADSDVLIYRVYIIPTDDITSSEVVTHLKEWISSTPTPSLISGVAEISLFSNCNISITSLDDPLCNDIEPSVGRTAECEGPFLDSNTLILIGVIAGTLFTLLFVIILVMTCMLVFQHRRLKRISIRKTSNQYSVVNCKRETSFIDHHKRSPPAMATPAIPTQRQWEGDVSISDCPAYLYSVKPLEDGDPSQTIVHVERQPTPGIYDSIDGLNNANFHHIKAANPLTTISKDIDDDCTGSSEDFS